VPLLLTLFIRISLHLHSNPQAMTRRSEDMRKSACPSYGQDGSSYTPRGQRWLPAVGGPEILGVCRALGGRPLGGA
jgi:hypothetical protein